MTGESTAAKIESTIRSLEDQRYAAMVAGDFDQFTALAHPDLVYTHSNAEIDTLDNYAGKPTAWATAHLQAVGTRLDAVGRAPSGFRCSGTAKARVRRSAAGDSARPGCAPTADTSLCITIPPLSYAPRLSSHVSNLCR
jgi:ketosteroid isomerase-like protein